MCCGLSAPQLDDPSAAAALLLPHPIALPSWELVTELTEVPGGLQQLCPARGGTGVQCAVQDIFPSKLLWTWLCPSSCPHPGSSNLVLIQQPQGYPQCMTAGRKMHPFLSCCSASGHLILQPPTCQLQLVLVSPECPAQAAGRAPSQGLRCCAHFCPQKCCPLVRHTLVMFDDQNTSLTFRPSTQFHVCPP